MLSDVLRGVVAQTLLRKKGGGRVAALEILAVSPAVGNLIREGKTVQLPGVIQINKGMGMQLLNDELEVLIQTRQGGHGRGHGQGGGQGRPHPPVPHRRSRWARTSLADETFSVVRVNPGSPGALAGFERGDHILELDGKPSKEFTLEEIRQSIRIDGKRMVTVNRAGKRVKLILELGGRESLMTPVVPPQRPGVAGAAKAAPPRR